MESRASQPRTRTRSLDKNNISRVSAANECDIILATRFSKDLRPLSENFRRFSKICPKVPRTLPNIFQRLPEIAEDFRGRPEDISIIHQRMLSTLDISESIDILTSEDMENTPLESQMWFRLNFTSGVFPSKTPVSI